MKKNLKERFALVRSNAGGSFDFIPGIDGMDQNLSEEEYEEYKKFWDEKNQVVELDFVELTKALMSFFMRG